MEKIKEKINKIINAAICLFVILILTLYTNYNSQAANYGGYEELGFFHFTPDEADCDPRVYYRLIRNSSGVIYYERYMCPPGFFFSCETNQCVMEGAEELYCSHIKEFLAE